MKITMHKNEVEITGISDFNLERIFECGQCFRWEADTSGAYTGVAMGKVAKLRRSRNGNDGGGNSGGGSIGVGDNGNRIGCGDNSNSVGTGGSSGSDNSSGSISYISGSSDSSNNNGYNNNSDSIFITCSPEDYETVWHNYFDIDRDYEAIRRKLCVDEYMVKATEFGAGIRILRQDKWEALCSFIISQCNNIPRIKKIIEALCRLCGERISFEDNEYFTFPSAQTLACMTAEDLAPIRCGYRADYIINAAGAVASGKLDLESLAKSQPEDARSQLKKIKGIGDKVADCAMLFGLHMLDAFPRDVWIKRALAGQYGDAFDPKIFTPHSGIAQQYIFHYARNGKKDEA